MALPCRENSTSDGRLSICLYSYYKNDCLEFLKIISFLKVFNKQIDNIQQRIDDFEIYIHKLHLEEMEINDILNPIICDITKKDDNFYIATELAKNCKVDENEKSIAYKSIDLHYHKILRRIQYQLEQGEEVTAITDESKENKKKLEALDEKLTDLRTGLTFKTLEAKIKDFEYRLLKPNTKR